MFLISKRESSCISYYLNGRKNAKGDVTMKKTGCFIGHNTAQCRVYKPLNKIAGCLDFTSVNQRSVFRSEKPSSTVLIICCSGVHFLRCILPEDNSSKPQPCQREQGGVSNFTFLRAEDIGSCLLLKVQECRQIIESRGLKASFIDLYI